MIGIEHIWGACCFAVGVVLATICLIAAVAMDDHACAAAKEDEQTELHIIVFAQDEDTEIGVKVGDKKRETELVDAGITYLSYKTENPEVTILAYGDKITPRIDKGRDGEYYAMVFLQAPGESVGEEE